MGKAQPIILDTRAFSKKGDAVLFFRAMLARYRDGQRVTPVDTLDLLALLKRHPDYAEKVGPGVNHFLVNENREYAQITRSFWIVRNDDTVDDVSFYECITPRSRYV
jgi:Protein of unknown function (DUF3223)